MPWRKSLLLAVVLGVAVGTSCVLRGPSGVRREIAEVTGADYDREFGLTLGRTSMAIARCAVKTTEDTADDAPGFSLKGIHKLQIGVYEVVPGTWVEDHRKFDPALLGSWEPVVRVQDDGEDVHVLLRTRNGETRELLVVVSEHDELVIIRMKGKLDRMLRDAVRFGLEEAGREELVAPVAERLDARDAASAGPG